MAAALNVLGVAWLGGCGIIERYGAVFHTAGSDIPGPQAHPTKESSTAQWEAADYLNAYNNYSSKDDSRTAKYYLNLGLQKFPQDLGLIKAKTYLDLAPNPKAMPKDMTMEDITAVATEIKKDQPVSFTSEFRIGHDAKVPPSNAALKEWFRDKNVDVDRFEFVDLYITTFGDVIKLNDHINRIVQSKGYTTATMDTLARMLRSAVLDVEVKSGAWGLFEQSKNELIKTSVPRLREAHALLSLCYQKALQGINGAALSPANQPEPIYNLNTQMEALFQALLVENKVVKAILLDEQKSLSNDAGILFLTQRQRAYLLHSLEEVFGSGIKDRQSTAQMLKVQQWGIELYRFIGSDGRDDVS